MNVGQKYAPHLIDARYDAIVIGSGLGGLTTAALLSKAGKKVLVLERHYTAGGFTHSFRRRGYEWDVGVHYIGEVHNQNSLIRRMFDTITDGQLQWARMDDVYDKIIFNDDCYDYVAGARNFRAELLRSFPQAGGQIDAYLQHIRAASRSLSAHLGARYLPQSVQGMVNARAAVGGYFTRTTKEVLAGFVTDPKLAAVLCGQWGDYGLPPGQSAFGMHAVVAQHYLSGASFPIGGASQIAHHIEPLIQRAGGMVAVNAEVEQILVRGQRAIGVRMANGDEILADKIISAAGVHNTFGKLLPDDVGRRHQFKDKLAELPPSVAHLGLYIGLKGNTEQLQLQQANRWVYRDYDHDKSFTRFLRSKPGSPSPLNYISFPSSKDPAWEKHYTGKSTIDVISLAPYEWFKKWRNKPWNDRGADYAEMKQQLSEMLLEDVYRQAPQVRGKVDYFELSTPLSTEHFNNYRRGEVYGLAHTPERFKQGWVKPHTPIKGLYLAGQDILFCGVASAMMSGAMTATAVLGAASVKVMPDLVAPSQRWLSRVVQRLPLGASRARSRAAREKIAPPPTPIRRLKARCVEVLEVTQDVKALRFVVAGDVPLVYQPGQFMTLELDIDRQKIFRSYTMSSSPTAGEVFEITVKRVEGGRVSNWLCDHVAPGTVLPMNGPHGHFTCAPKPRPKLLMLSAGSGVTPMLSMARWMRDQGMATDTVFFHSARTQDDFIFGDEMQALADTHPNFVQHISLTRAARNKRWQGLRGHLNAEMLGKVAPDFAERTVYICGPEGFMADTKSMLQEAGFPMIQFHAESFGGAGTVEACGGQVHFVKSNVTVDCGGQQSLLDVALQTGIKIGNACRTGDCGECKVRKVSGDTPMANNAGLAQHEVDDGYVLSCVAFINNGVAIEA